MPETCCQTLVGHGASVTAILDSRKGYVVSSSNDGSVKVWRPQDVHAPHSSSKAVFFLDGSYLSATLLAISPIFKRKPELSHWYL
jgi:WD40 repeat protein